MAQTFLGTDHYVYRRDGKLYVRKVGSGDPLVLLHINGLSGWSWRKVIDDLSREFTCYIPDLPGFDNSDIPAKPYSMEDYMNTVLDVMDAAGLKQTHLVGARTGAIIGLMLGAYYPERVDRLVLNGLPYWDKPHGEIIWEKFFLPQFTDVASYHVPVNPMTTWEEDKAKNPKLEREAWEVLHKIYERSRPWITSSERAHTGTDIQAIGRKVKTPTLLLYGENDVLLRGSQKAHDDMTGSVIGIVEGSDGLTFDDKPKEFVSNVVHFLRR